MTLQKYTNLAICIHNDFDDAERKNEKQNTWKPNLTVWSIIFILMPETLKLT